MSSSQINALASTMEGILQAEVPQPSNIKIRFKKGAMLAKPGDKSAAVNAMASQLPIRLSPESEKKRKVAEGMDFEIDEHVVSDITGSCRNYEHLSIARTH